jgi:hypothetical protein
VPKGDEALVDRQNVEVLEVVRIGMGLGGKMGGFPHRCEWQSTIVQMIAMS